MGHPGFNDEFYFQSSLVKGLCVSQSVIIFYVHSFACLIPLSHIPCERVMYMPMCV